MEPEEFLPIDVISNLERLQNKGYKYLVLVDELDQASLNIPGGYTDAIFVEGIPQVEVPQDSTPFVPLNAEGIDNAVYSYLVRSKYFD
jgi:hypothetical protein